MKNQQSSPGAETPVVDLQRMAFKKLQDDGHEAVFQAKIPDSKMPDAPAPVLTVTVASPRGNKEATQELNEFLNEMRAGFAVTELKADGGQSDDEDSDEGQSDDEDPGPFNIDDEIQFTFGKPEPSSNEGAVGMTIVVQTTVEEYSTQRLPDSVVAHRAHRYTAGQKVQARVASSAGSARVRPGRRRINTGGFYDVNARTITIRGITDCSYTITGEGVFTRLY